MNPTQKKPIPMPAPAAPEKTQPAATEELIPICPHDDCREPLPQGVNVRTVINPPWIVVMGFCTKCLRTLSTQMYPAPPGTSAGEGDPGPRIHLPS